MSQELFQFCDLDILDTYFLYHLFVHIYIYQFFPHTSLSFRPESLRRLAEVLCKHA